MDLNILLLGNGGPSRQLVLSCGISQALSLLFFGISFWKLVTRLEDPSVAWKFNAYLGMHFVYKRQQLNLPGVISHDLKVVVSFLTVFFSQYRCYFLLLIVHFVHPLLLQETSALGLWLCASYVLLALTAFGMLFDHKYVLKCRLRIYRVHWRPGILDLTCCEAGWVGVVSDRMPNK